MRRIQPSVWKGVVLHTIVPAGFTILLFAVFIFAFLLPQIKQTIYEEKRQAIKELVNTVFSLIELHHEQVANGQLTLEQAQHEAKEHIRAMRYGSDRKDYFWINDLQPVMIMHPYTTELEGLNVSEYTDVKGKYLFKEFIHTAKTMGAGYVDYQWQWQDAPDKIVPKVSYVRLFEPWGWILGSGMYIEDIKAEINRIIYNLRLMFFFTLAITFIIILYLIWHGVGMEMDRGKYHLEREKLLKELAAKNEEVQSFVYAVSHDLRSPLVNLHGFSRELKRSYQTLLPLLNSLPDNPSIEPDKARQLMQEIPESLEFITSSTDKMDTLVNGLLELSRVGTKSILIQSIDVNETVESILKAMNFQLEQLDATVHVDLLPKCLADHRLLSQVFSNLLENAMKYRHPERNLEISISAKNSKDNIEYAVRDNGIGIEPKEQDKIFEVFHQIDPASDSGGIGMGLTIVKRILYQLQGSIRVESQVGQFTTFIITLPAA